MEDNLTMQSAFSLLLADFFKTFGIEPFSVNIAIPDDISKAYFELRSDHETEFTNRLKLENYNGLVVPPKEFSESFTILINRNYLLDSLEKDNRNWIGTLAHEATHIDDFMNFAKIMEVTDYDIIWDKSKFRMFHFWTEFNAKAKGYYFLRKHALDDIRDETLLQYVLEEELPNHMKSLFESYHSTDDGDEQMYNVVHFLGRLHVLQDLYPMQFTNDFVYEYFRQNIWMYELFIFLCSHTTLEKAYKDFDEMKEILKTNFNGL